jgi:hypothetical protein
MIVRHLGLVVPVIAAALFVVPAALADTHLYDNEAAAAQACGSDEVVFINLDNGRFYHKAQGAYGKSKNGGYSCLKDSHAYREGHDG